MNEIKIGKIDVINVNVNDKELFIESVENIIKDILEKDPNADYVYCLDVDAGNEPNSAMENMRRAVEMFRAVGINNVIVFPNSSIKISGIKVIHEYRDEKDNLI